MADIARTVAEARALGATRYFTGKPCPKGHVAERCVSKSTCVECKKLHCKRYSTTEKFKQICKDWSDRNRAKRTETTRVWRALPEVKERSRILRKKYRLENIEKIRKLEVQYTNKRRARKKAAGGKFTVVDAEALLKKQKHKCAYCFANLNGKYELDHIMPLSRGGDHSPSNIQITCGPCNRSKHVKDPIVFAQSLGRLI